MMLAMCGKSGWRTASCSFRRLQDAHAERCQLVRVAWEQGRAHPVARLPIPFGELRELRGIDQDEEVASEGDVDGDGDGPALRMAGQSQAHVARPEEGGGVLEGDRNRRARLATAALARTRPAAVSSVSAVTGSCMGKTPISRRQVTAPMTP